MKSKKLINLLACATLAATMLVGCGKSGLKDGKYEAKGEKDDKGYVASINIEVKGGKITTVKYDEVGEKGSKLNDADYNSKMEAKSGSNPIKAFPALEKSLVEKQDASAVDTVTGATHTTESFKTLAEKALSEAK